VKIDFLYGPRTVTVHLNELRFAYILIEMFGLCFILYRTGQELRVSRRLRLPDFQKIGLPDVHTGRLYPQGNISDTNVC
jgi:hypothetical protein